ncbi:MAG TPA: FHA domain-containing protein [Caldilinea sp.]|nr:FHA domain-containing protein [Caldilinea sp.]
MNFPFKGATSATCRVVCSALIVLLLFVSFQTILPARMAQAQDAAEPILTITGVDPSQLPLIRVTAYGANLKNALAELPITLTEDNVEQPILDSRPVDVGVQVGILFDLSNNVLPRYGELADAAERFRVAQLSAETDWLAAYSVNLDDGTLRVISDWSQDHQGMANLVRMDAPDRAPAATPLFGLISDALDRFASSATPSNLRRTLVVLSDGADPVSAQQLETIVRKAARFGITIDAVMIGDARNAASRRNLEQIALETGGAYWDYSSADKITAIEEMWQRFGAQRQQQEYTYRLTKPQPSEVGMALTYPDGRTLTARYDFPAVNVRPPSLELLIPPPDYQSVRIADASDTPLSDISPTSLPIQLNITWPDNHQRAIQRIEYEVGGRTVVQNSEPFGAIDFPIDTFDNGVYTVRVAAVDELGLEGKSAPVSFTVQVIRPTPAPTDTPEPTPTDTPEPEAFETATPASVAQNNQAGSDVSDLGSTIVIPPLAANMAFSTTLPVVGLVGYGTSSQGGNALFVGTRVIPVTPVTILIAIMPLLLIAAAAVMLMRRKPPVDDVFTTATEAAYDSTAFDSKPTMVEQTAYELTEDATEPQVMVNFISPASLIYVDGGDHLPSKLDIEGGREVRIGRKQAYCDIIIDDQRVSRLHASIVEKDDGKFYLKDEGSSGGTYVNRHKLRVNDMVELHHGDIINLNTVSYRFELNDQSEQNQS